jgi:hypothetical protein
VLEVGRSGGAKVACIFGGYPAFIAPPPQIVSCPSSTTSTFADMELPARVLRALDEASKLPIASTEAFPDVEPTVLKGALDSLHSREMIVYETIDREEPVLTPEAEGIVRDGSHEAKVYEAVCQQLQGIKIGELPVGLSRVRFCGPVLMRYRKSLGPPVQRWARERLSRRAGSRRMAIGLSRRYIGCSPDAVSRGALSCISYSPGQSSRIPRGVELYKPFFGESGCIPRGELYKLLFGESSCGPRGVELYKPSFGESSCVPRCELYMLLFGESSCLPRGVGLYRPFFGKLGCIPRDELYMLLFGESSCLARGVELYRLLCGDPGCVPPGIDCSASWDTKLFHLLTSGRPPPSKT